MADAEITAPARLEAVARSRLLDTLPEEPFDRLASLARDLTGAPMAFVNVVDARRSFWKSCIGVTVQDGEPTELPLEESFCQYVVATGEPLVLPDVRLDDRTKDNPSIQAHGVVAWAGYPVHTPDGQVLGTFCVVDTQRRDWTPMDVRVLDVLAKAVSSEIGLRMQVDRAQREATIARSRTERAEGHAAEFEHVALVLQRSLLTPPPRLVDLDIEVRYIPAAAHAQIGGDWYDAFVQPDGTTVVVVGDVVGHDIQAAAAMGQIRNLVRALAYRTTKSPAEILMAVDDAMHGLHVGSMATVVVAHVADTDPAYGTRCVRWSSAGHLPPLMTTPGGGADVLEASPNLLLGVRPGVARQDHEDSLHPGATLLLFTDGLIEQRDRSMQHRLEDLKELVTKLSAEPLDTLCDSLIAHCLPSEPEDDVALLALRLPDRARAGHG